MRKKSSKIQNVKHVERVSADMLAERVAELKVLFPDAVVEGKIDFGKLRSILSDEADDGPERYNFTWAGKRDAIRLLQMPSRATLVLKPASTERVFLSLGAKNTRNPFVCRV